LLQNYLYGGQHLPLPLPLVGKKHLFHLVIFPLTSLHLAVGPGVRASSVLVAANELAFVVLPVGVRVLALAVSKVVPVFA
jgi:hypothetical protein